MGVSVLCKCKEDPSPKILISRLNLSSLSAAETSGTRIGDEDEEERLRREIKIGRQRWGLLGGELVVEVAVGGEEAGFTEMLLNGLLAGGLIG